MTDGLLPLDQGLFGRLRRDAGAAWDDYVGHDFVRALGRGTAAGGRIPALPHSGLPVPHPFRPRARACRLQGDAARRYPRCRSGGLHHRRCGDAAARRVLRRLGAERGTDGRRARGDRDDGLYAVRAGARPGG